MVAVLVLVLVAAIIQLALALHVRTVLIDSAGEGARHGALSGADLGDGVERTRLLITSTLPESYAGEVSASRESAAGVELVVVRVRAPLPLFGLLGPAVVEVTGRAVAE